MLAPREGRAIGRRARVLEDAARAAEPEERRRAEPDAERGDLVELDLARLPHVELEVLGRRDEGSGRIASSASRCASAGAASAMVTAQSPSATSVQAARGSWAWRGRSRHAGTSRRTPASAPAAIPSAGHAKRPMASKRAPSSPTSVRTCSPEPRSSERRAASRIAPPRTPAALGSAAPSAFAARVRPRA
ncbi:MAG: hypothetical protein M5U28_39590 [Sandaracinaceae bacterium]|nr:hypothetical protein [Sandaracinaceae bacterium]